MTPEEYAQLVGALKALGGVGGLGVIVLILWKQFLSEAAANKKKVARDLETRVFHLEQRTDGTFASHRLDIETLKKDVAVLQDRSDHPRAGVPQLGPEGPTVMNYPNPILKRRVTKSLPAAQPELEEPLEEEEKT